MDKISVFRHLDSIRKSGLANMYDKKLVAVLANQKSEELFQYLDSLSGPEYTQLLKEFGKWNEQQ